MGPYELRAHSSESASRPSDGRRTHRAQGDRAAHSAARSTGETSMIRTLPLLRAVGCCALVTATLTAPAWSAEATASPPPPTVPPTGNPTSPVPTNRLVVDDTLTISVAIPSTWTDVSTAPGVDAAGNSLPQYRGSPQPRFVRELLRHAGAVLRRDAVHGRHRRRCRRDGLQPSLRRRRNDSVCRRLLHRPHEDVDELRWRSGTAGGAVREPGRSAVQRSAPDRSGDAG